MVYGYIFYFATFFLCHLDEPKKIYKNVMELDRKISKEFGLKLIDEIEESMM